MKWTDVQEIAIALSEARPEVDPRSIRFTDLYRWILALDGFADGPGRCNERVLEAVQAAWIAESL